MRKTNLFILVTIAIQLEKLISVINIVMLFQVSFLIHVYSEFPTGIFLTKNTPRKTFNFNFCLQSTEKAIKIIIASMIFSNLI